MRTFTNILFAWLIVFTTVAQNTTPTLESVTQCLQFIEEQERYVDDLYEIVTDGSNAANLPVGIKKIIGNIPVTLAVNQVKLGQDFGEINLFMEMEAPQQSKKLRFAATGIKISFAGDLIGDVHLSLLNDVPLPMGSLGTLIIKGADTYVTLSCDGDVTGFSLNANVTLNQNTFHLAGQPGAAVTAPFKIAITDWNDLIAAVSFPAFEINGVDGFEFTVANATFDYSDLHNPISFRPDDNYMREYFTLPERNLWRGVYVEQFAITFPEWFKIKDSSERITIAASQLLIDENGITGNISATNILPLQNGDAGGWPLSITDFYLSLTANNISRFGFGGQINVPLSEKDCLLNYQALISNNNYLFTAKLSEYLDIDLFGNAQLQLNSTSFLTVELKNGQFRPQLVLNGSMKLDKEGLAMEQIVFHKLKIASEAPILSVEAVEYGGEVKFSNFPITISNIGLNISNDQATLGFDLKLNMMEGRISADSRLAVTSELKGGRWKYKSLAINKIALDNIEMAGFKLSGEIRMEKDHPVYGDYFGGRINATFNALSDGLKVGVSAVFGYKDFRYWYVEGTAKFHPGITIGPVALNGFTGGAYYKMSATGKTGLEAYAPDKKSSLGVKAGVAFIIGNENAVHGNALFEMNFLSGGGIKNIRFYGTAALMAGSNSDDEDKIAAQYQAAQSSMTDMSQSVTDKLSPSLSGSDIAKSVFPGGIPDIGINAYITMNYDFPAKTFDANFKVMVNMAGGFLKGAGSNGEAGWATMHCSPGSWYFHVGTPANPIGVKLGLGSLSLTTTSYFMLGDKLEPALPPPDEVLSILKISSHQADYMKYPQDMKLGKGVAFGSRFKFDTGNLNFLIIYAHFAAGIGFDLMLSDMSHYACEGSNSPIGINGWYANGQTYAFLEGELGVKINLLFIKKNVPVIQGATAALLQAKGPNPTWIGGQMALKLNVLGGLIRADMKMKFSFGNDCKLVRLEHDSFPIDYPIIADVSPADYSDEIDVFTIPQVTFNMPEGSSIVSDNKKTYRIRLESFTLTDSKGAVIAGKMEWNMKRDALRFIATEILPSSDQMKIKITVNFEESTGNAWKQAMFNGKPAKEEKEITFKTGEAPNYIPKQNIEYLYPLMEQKNMFMSESNTGYIKLKRGQKYLFPAGFTYQTVFTPETGSAVNAAYSYKPADQIIEYTLPVLEKGKNYVLDFTVAGNAGKSGNAGIKTEIREITDESGETFSVDIEQQMAGQAIKEDAVSILDYTFRTSQYHTLAEKLSSLSFTPAQIYINEDTRSLYLKTSGSHELFDAAELAGTEYTDNKPLIQMEATLTDDYYTIDIAPKLYNWHPLPDISITKRDVAEYGAPPAKAITLYNGYLNMVIANTYNAALSQTFPFIYNLPYYYSKDYVELFNKAVNYLYNDPSSSYKEQLMPLLTGHFLFIRQGEYPVKFAYRLPGNRQGATRDKTINYVNTLDWR